MSRNTVAVEMTEERDDNSAIHIGLNYTIDTLIEKYQENKACNLSFKFLCIDFFARLLF